MLLCFGKSEVIITNLIYFFLSKTFLKNLMEYAFYETTQESSEMCMEWDKKRELKCSHN
jgi:hypothetical protein